MSRRPMLIALTVLLGTARWANAADTVTLRGGTALRGLILDHRSDETVLKLRTDRGELPILRSTVERVERDPDTEARYWLAREYFDETANGLFDVALWCQANKLLDQRDEHLDTLLQIEPDHAEARKLLGYTRRGQEWVFPGEESLRSDAKSDPPARVVPSSEGNRTAKIELLKKRREALQRQQELAKTITRLAAWLEGNKLDQLQQAREQLATLRDPLAIGPLTRAMGKASTANRQRMIQAIGGIPDPASAYALAIASVVDVSPDARGLAIDLLRERPDDKVRYLPVIEQALRSEKPGLIYNASEALADLGGKRSIPRLIGSLETESRTILVDKPGGGILAYDGWVPGIQLIDVWIPYDRKIGEIPLTCPP